MVVAPTFTVGGYTFHECACGESYRTDKTAALGHNYVESGLETYTCTRCGDTYTDHTHSYTTTVVEPTCTEDGYTLYECACGASYQDNVVPMLGHSKEGRLIKAGLATGIASVIPTYGNPEISVRDAIGSLVIGFNASFFNAAVEIVITHFLK